MRFGMAALKNRCHGPTYGSLSTFSVYDAGTSIIIYFATKRFVLKSLLSL